MNRALLLAFMLATGCVSRPDMPPDIRKETHRVSLGRENVAVDFYHRSGASARPLAVVAHRFFADKNRMAQWTVILVRAGFLVAAPTSPT